MFLSWIFKYSLLMVTVPRYPKWRWLMGEGPFVAIIQRKRGLLGFKLFCFLTACSRLNQSEGLVASIQWKARLASVFTTLQIFSSKGVWWVRDCSLPSFSDKKASLHLVWLVSFYVYLWWWRCWIWACSIFLSEHGSETRHGKRPEPRATLCLLEYDCGANALG